MQIMFKRHFYFVLTF